MKSVIILTLLIGAFAAVDPPQEPVIGIYTQDKEDIQDGNSWMTYIAASYVKNIEMAGGQVVPLFWHLTEQQLEK